MSCEERGKVQSKAMRFDYIGVSFVGNINVQSYDQLGGVFG